MTDADSISQRSMVRDYAYFGYRISSDIAFPELEAPDGQVQSTIILRAGEVSLADCELVHQWQDGDTVELSCWRSGDEVCLSIPDALLMRFSPSDHTVCYRADADLDEASLHHLLLDQVLPRVISDYGEIMIHASSVSFEGSAVAFLGATGAGKSTLASGFVAAGWSLLTDDCLHLSGMSRRMVSGGYPGIRIDPEVSDRLLPTAEQGARMAAYSGKFRIQPDSQSVDRKARPLKALFCLVPGEEIDVAPLTGATATMAMVQETFVLDPTDTRRAHELVAFYADLIAGGLPVYQLTVPRDLAVLESVRAAVVETIESCR